MPDPAALKPVPLSVARSLGQTAHARRLAVIAVGDDGMFSVTTWGRTKADCTALRQWAEGPDGDYSAADSLAYVIARKEPHDGTR